MFILITIGFIFVGIVISIWGFASFGESFGVAVMVIWLLMGWIYVKIVERMDESNKKRRLDAMTPEDREKYEHDEFNKKMEFKRKIHGMMYGSTNKEVICPHCKKTGCVRDRYIDKKSRTTRTIPFVNNETVTTTSGTQLHCDNCDITWFV